MFRTTGDRAVRACRASCAAPCLNADMAAVVAGAIAVEGVEGRDDDFKVEKSLRCSVTPADPHRRAVGKRQQAGMGPVRSIGGRRFPETELLARVAGERLIAN